jgi:translocation and assembly module TamB
MRLSVRPRRLLLLLGVGIFLVLFGVYFERKAITRRFADAELVARKINAKYELKSIGPRVQRIENLVLGDPRSPDLTADWVEIQLGLGWSGVGVSGLRASGVRLQGRYANGTLNFGALDRLLPTPSDEPFSLPDIDIALVDTTVLIRTDFGDVTTRINGQGNLVSGFVGRVQSKISQIRTAKFEAADVATQLEVLTKQRRIEFGGPVSIGRFMSGENSLGPASLQIKGTSNESFTRVGANWAISTAVEKLAFGAAKRIRGDGRFDLDAGSQRIAARLQIDGARPGSSAQAWLKAALPQGAGTPLEPLDRQIQRSFAQLENGSVATLPVEYRLSDGQRTLLVGPPTVLASSGARFVGSGRGLIVPLDRGQASFDGVFGLSGGGFPAGTVRLKMSKGNWIGTARFQPYRAGSARLVLTPIELSYSEAGLGLRTVALLDGPLGGGKISGLKVPISFRPGRVSPSGCFVPGFRSLDIGGLHLAPASFRTCISGNEARMAAISLTGRLGSSPLEIAANNARIGFSRGDFAISGVAGTLGDIDKRSIFQLDNLSGTFAKSAANGLFSGASGLVGNVPLKISEGRGRWQFAANTLQLNGGLRVADRAADPRFNPLVSDDFSLRLSDNQIHATGIAREPKTALKVAVVDIKHDLSSGSGGATLDVDGLTFGQQLQPEMLTNTTLGVIANVIGRIDGRGLIRWTSEGATSSGTFRTDNLDLAAAFGPVTGLKGEIALSDLLGLETAAGQSVSIASINPGIAVNDGIIRYQLLPDLKVRIEGGRWPFAGGWLILETTMFDLSQAAERRLTFRVEGLDAGQFINQLQFENIDATGIYDGVLPMIFDQQGGRIEGGRLVARNGGTLAYVGEISNQNLGTMGRVAFDALKSIKYDRLSIDLGGPIDGDVVTRISFAGVNQAPIQGVRAKLPIPIRITGLTNFPFIFNVTITAPFRKLFDMSRTISDPSLLIERLNPNLQRIGPAKTIQPSESAPVGKQR